MINATPRPLYTQENDSVLMLQEVGLAPGTVWTGARYFAPSRIRSPDRPARSKSLFRPNNNNNNNNNNNIEDFLSLSQLSLRKNIFSLETTNFFHNVLSYFTILSRQFAKLSLAINNQDTRPIATLQS